MTRWTEAQDTINNLDDGPIKEALEKLLVLIMFTYASIPEVE